MNLAKRQDRARRKAKANRLSRWQGVPQNTRVADARKWAWLMNLVRP